MAEFNTGAAVREKKVLGVLDRKNKPVSKAQIAHDLAVSVKLIEPTLKRLVDDGKVVRTVVNDVERYRSKTGVMRDAENAVRKKPMSQQEIAAYMRQTDALKARWAKENDAAGRELTLDERIEQFIFIQQNLHPEDKRYFDEESLKNIRAGIRDVDGMMEDVENGELDPVYAAGLALYLGKGLSKDEAEAKMDELCEKSRAKKEEEAKKASEEEEAKKRKEEKDMKAIKTVTTKLPDTKGMAEEIAKDTSVDSAVKKKANELMDKGTRLPKEERMYRIDVCLDFIMRNPNCSYSEIAQGHVVDHRYGRLTYAMVQETVQSIYGTSGAWLRNTRGQGGKLLWSIDGIPIDISERINRRIEEIRAKEIDVKVDNFTGNADPQVYHVASVGDMKELQADSVTVNSETTVVNAQNAIIPTMEESADDVEMEYEFVIHNGPGSVKPTAGSIKEVCKRSEAAVAARVLSKASNREVTVQVVTVSTVIRCKPDDE